MSILSIATAALLVVAAGPTKKSAGVWPKDFAKGEILKPLAPPPQAVRPEPSSVDPPKSSAEVPRLSAESNSHSAEPNRALDELLRQAQPKSPYQKLQESIQPFIEIGDRGHAEPALETRMKSYPGDFINGVYLADAYLAEGRNDDALKLHESIAANAASELKRESPFATQHFWSCASLVAALHGDV
jgi:hypothetical protein